MRPPTAGFIADVPTIGALFSAQRPGRRRRRILLATRHAGVAGLGGIAVSAAALISIRVSMTDTGLFDYTGPAFGTAVVIAIAAEAAVEPAARPPCQAWVDLT